MTKRTVTRLEPGEFTKLERIAGQAPDERVKRAIAAVLSAHHPECSEAEVEALLRDALADDAYPEHVLMESISGCDDEREAALVALLALAAVGG